MKPKYIELQNNACTLATKVERLELEIQNVTTSIHSLEEVDCISFFELLKLKIMRMCKLKIISYIL